MNDRAKKVLFFLSIVLVLSTFAAFADESEYYFKSINLAKIYPHDLGYRVLYLRSDATYGVLYIPHKWFRDSAGKGDLILGNDRTYPYISIFWKDGEFSHVRLYLNSKYTHPSWGTLDPDIDYSSKFDIDEITLEIQ